MDPNDQLNYDDPQFGKVVKTCLEMEIAAAEEKMDANMMKIKKQTTIIRAELDKRKQLKKEVMLMNQIYSTLSETLRNLYLSIRETTDNLEILKANADPEYKLLQLQAKEYQDIIAEYKQTWHDYHAMYEELPLAKARKAAKIELEKIKFETMTLTFKKTEIMKMIKQKEHIDWIRTRNKIIEFAAAIVERMKMEKELSELRMSVKYHKEELCSLQIELKVLKKKDEEQKKLRQQKMLEMAPPKINMPCRGIYAKNQTARKYQDQWKQVTESFDDNISVNTLALEELCINKSPEMIEIIDVEMESENNPNFIAVQEENIAHFESTAFSKEPKNTRAASIASDVEENGEKMVFSSDANSAEIKEIHKKETQESHETVKAHPSFRTKENSLKHSVPKNTENEIEAKRIRLQSSIESSSKLTTTHALKASFDNWAVQSSIISKEMDLPPPPSCPKIQTIESVHYKIMPITSKPAEPTQAIQHANKTWDASSMFSAASSRHEYCESEMSFDQASKGSASLYEGSLCNFNLSPTSNISTYIDENTRMTSPPKHTLQEKQKQAADKTLPLNFNAPLSKFF